MEQYGECSIIWYCGFGGGGGGGQKMFDLERKGCLKNFYLNKKLKIKK